MNSQSFPTRNFSLDDTHVATPTLTNTFRFTHTRVAEQAGLLRSLGWDDLGVKITVPEVLGYKWMSVTTSNWNLSARRPGDGIGLEAATR